MANQIVINIGALPNDGTGDPLRTAFNDVNLNFANIWATGVANSNIAFSGNKILTTNTNGNLILAPNGIGVVQSNVSIVPNINRAHNLGSSTKKWDTLYVWYGEIDNANISNANIASIGNLTIDVGNLHITGGSNGYVLQTDGTGNLTWTAQTGGTGNGTPGGANTQIQYNNAGSFGGTSGFTFDKDTGNMSVPGNIGLGSAIYSTGLDTVTVIDDLTVLGHVNAVGYYLTEGSGSLINLAGNVVDLNSIGNLQLQADSQTWKLDTSGALTLPDGSILAGGGLYGNDTAVLGNASGAVQAYAQNTGFGIQTYSGNSYPTWFFDNTGNLTLPTDASNINYANGMNILNGVASNYGDSNVTTLLANFGSNTVSTSGNVTAANVSVSTLTSGEIAIASTGGQLVGGPDLLWDFGNASLFTTGLDSNGAITTSGTISATGDITTGGNFVTSGSGGDITLTGGNITGANNISLSGNVTAANLGNITPINLDGNVSNVLAGDGTWIAQTTGGTPAGIDRQVQFNNNNAFGASSGLTFGSDGNLNVNGGFLNAAAVVTTGRIEAGTQLTADGDLYVYGNSNQGNIFPNTSNVYSLGNVDYQWKDLWVSNTTIYMNSVPISVTSANVLTVDGEEILSNNSNTTITTSGNITANNISTSGTGGSITMTGGNITGMNGISALGNITAAYFIGDGSQLTNLPVQPGTYGDSNVTSLLGTFGSNTISTTGNVTAGYVIGDGSQLTNLPIQPGTYGDSNVASLLGSFGSNTISTSGNVTAGYVIGDGSQLTNLPIQPGTYSNSNVTSLMSTFGSNTISTTGNVTAGYVIGDGSQLTNLPIQPGTYGDSNVTSLLANFGPNTISTTGNIDGGNINTGVIHATTVTNLDGTLTLQTGSTYDLVLNPSANISVNNNYINNLRDPAQAQDAATKKYVDDNAAGLNVHNPVLLASTTDLATYTGATVTYNNGTSGVGATLSLTGNTLTTLDGTSITGGSSTRLLIKNEANAVLNGVYTYTSNTLLTRATDMDQPAELSGGDYVFVQSGVTQASSSWVQQGAVGNVGVGNVNFVQFSASQSYSAGNALALNGSQFNVNVDNSTIAINGSNQLEISPTAVISTSGNITGGNILTSGVVSSTGNTYQSNVIATGYVTATGNITGNYFIGNGSQLTGFATVAFTGDYANLSNVPTIPTNTNQLVNGNGFITSATANVISVNGQTGVVNVVEYSNTAVATYLSSGTDSANIITTGNISGTYILGNAAYMTGIPAGYSDSNVTTLLASFGSNTISTTGNISGTFVAPGSNTQIWFNDAGVANAVSGLTFNKTSNILTSSGNIVTGGQIQSSAFAGGNISWSAVNQTDFGGNIKVGTNIIKSGGGATSIILNNNGANISVLGVTSTANSTSTTTGAIIVSGGAGVAGNINAGGKITTGAVTYANTDGTNGQLLTTYGNGVTYWSSSAYSNASVSGFLAAYGSNTISSTGNITTTANISGGNLLTSGLISATGNITGGNIIGNFVSPGANTQVIFNDGGIENATAGFTFNKTTNAVATTGTVSATANITGGNLLTGGIVSATSDVWAASGNFRSGAVTANIVNNTPTTVNIGGNASIAVNIGNASGVVSLSGNVQGNTNGFAIGYRDIPQVTFSGNATITLSDAGKHYYSTSGSNLTLTIANSTSANFAVGAAINIINQGTGTITVAQGSGVTMYFAGNSTSGNRTLSSYGMATLQKVATDTWFIVGVGVT